MAKAEASVEELVGPGTLSLGSKFALPIEVATRTHQRSLRRAGSLLDELSPTRKLVPNGVRGEGGFRGSRNQQGNRGRLLVPLRFSTSTG